MHIHLQKKHLYAALVVAHLADLYRVHRQNKTTFYQMKVKLVEADETIKSLNSQMGYLVNLLNKHEIKLDEFDYIALPNVRPREENTA